jgi:hypothetical protein
MVVGLNVHELADEDSYQKASHDVHEQGTERKSVRGEVLDSPAYQVAEHGTRGATEGDQKKNHSVLKPHQSKPEHDQPHENKDQAGYPELRRLRDLLPPQRTTPAAKPNPHFFAAQCINSVTREERPDDRGDTSCYYVWWHRISQLVLLMDSVEQKYDRNV